MTKLPLTPRDVNQTKDALTKLLRAILLKRGIDTTKFYELHQRNFGGHFDDSNKKELSTHRNNMRRNLVEDTVTWKKFLTILTGLLKANVKELAIVIDDPATGKEERYSSKEVLYLNDDREEQEKIDFSALNDLTLSFKTPDDTEVQTITMRDARAVEQEANEHVARFGDVPTLAPAVPDTNAPASSIPVIPGHVPINSVPLIDSTEACRLSPNP